jgi:tetratricopeptide (TPR) repeat protein
MIGLAHLERGRIDSAINTMEESVRLGERSGFIIAQISTRSDLAYLYANLGNFEPAFELVAQAMKRAKKIGMFINIYCLGTQAQIHLIMGDLKAAEASLEDISNRLMNKPELVLDFSAYHAFIDLNLRLGKIETALKIANYSLDFTSRNGLRPAQMRILMQRAEGLQALNKMDEARADLIKAQILGSALGSVWTMWQIEAQLGHLEKEPIKAQTHFQSARTHIKTLYKHTPEPLRDSFLNRASVRAVLDKTSPIPLL